MQGSVLRHAVVIERAGTGYSAYVPDLPGCVATGRTLATIQSRIRTAMAMHLVGMREDGITVPKPSARAAYISAQAPRKKAG
jgi:predicted RNase H-like HicB family nuclease